MKILYAVQGTGNGHASRASEFIPLFRLHGSVDVLLSGNSYLESLESCQGLICGAGFEAPAEGLYLGKKLMVIPMKNQYEQKCNAAALNEMGVNVVDTIKKDFPSHLKKWLDQHETINPDYADNKWMLVDQVLELAGSSAVPVNLPELPISPVKNFPWENIPV